jgi:hypothetical protein
MIIIKSLYLALGSISLYIFLNEMKLFYIYTQFGWSNYIIQLTIIGVVLSLLSGLLLVYAYYGFIFEKKRLNPRFVGLLGCSVFLVYIAYEIYTLRARGVFEWGRDAIYLLPQFILFIFVIILLASTLIFWNRLCGLSNNQD